MNYVIGQTLYKLIIQVLDDPGNTLVPLSVWTDQIHNVSLWDPNTMTRSYFQTSMYTLLSELARNLLSLSMTNFRTVVNGTLNYEPEVRYILVLLYLNN